MKTIVSILALVGLLACTAQVQAQISGPQTLFSTAIAAPAGVATNGTGVINGSQQASVGLTFIVSPSGSSTATNGYVFQFSDDGVNYGTNLTLIPYIQTGTGSKVYTTNLSMGNHLFAKLLYVTNGDASVTVTNTVKWALKTQAP